MRILAHIVPSLSIAVLTLLAALPWGLPSEGRFFLPLLPFVAIHYWTLRHAERVPEWMVFLSGLTLDVLTNGPLGYWALIYLVGYVLAVASTPWAEDGAIGRWLLFLAALVLLAVAEWTLSSLYHFELADWRPFAWAAVATAFVYPLFAFLLRSLDPDHGQRRNLSFERGV